MLRKHKCDHPIIDKGVGTNNGFNDSLFELVATHLTLEWVYQNGEILDHFSLSSFVPPPPEELEVLFDRALRGNMREIRERADQVGQMDAKYKPFTEKLRHLAHDFQDKAILALIEQSMEDDQ